MKKSPLHMLGVKPKSPLNDTGDPIEKNNIKARIEGLRLVTPKKWIKGTVRKEEGHRTDYIPRRQTLISEGIKDKVISQHVYDRGKEMVADSLGLVNTGKGVKATQLYGSNLGEELRSSTGAGHFESKVRKIDDNVMYPLHTAEARLHVDRGGWAEGENVATGEKHHDYSRVRTIMSPSELNTERKRRKK